MTRPWREVKQTAGAIREQQAVRHLHPTTLRSYFYDHCEAMRYARAMAHYEGVKYRVERRERNTFFRYEVLRTETPVNYAGDELAA